jgi:hypothetical protein
VLQSQGLKRHPQRGHVFEIIAASYTGRCGVLLYLNRVLNNNTTILVAQAKILVAQVKPETFLDILSRVGRLTAHG